MSRPVLSQSGRPQISKCRPWARRFCLGGLMLSLAGLQGVSASGSDLPAKLNSSPSAEEAQIDDAHSCAGQVGLCSFGIAAKPTLRDLSRNFAAGSTVALRDFQESDPCLTPLALPLVPIPMTIELASATTLADEGGFDAATILSRWEKSTRQQSPLTERDVAWLQRRNEPLVTGHRLDVALQLLGQVTVAGLQEQYAWSVRSSDFNGVWLDAVPRDEMVRLFCPKISLRLSTEGTVDSLQLTDRAGELIPVAVVQTAATRPANSTQNALMQAIPPSPSDVSPVSQPLIRFAAGVDPVDLERE